MFVEVSSFIGSNDTISVTFIKGHAEDLNSGRGWVPGTVQDIQIQELLVTWLSSIKGRRPP